MGKLFKMEFFGEPDRRRWRVFNPSTGEVVGTGWIMDGGQIMLRASLIRRGRKAGRRKGVNHGPEFPAWARRLEILRIPNDVWEKL